MSDDSQHASAESTAVARDTLAMNALTTEADNMRDDGDVGATVGSGGGAEIEDVHQHNLPGMMKLGSDLPEELASWYRETFSDELNEVKKSMEMASDKVKSIMRTSLGPSTAIEDDTATEKSEEMDDLSSSVSTKLEIALMQANQEMENQTKERDLLEKRLACLEEVEELRMKLSSFELQHLLETKAEEGIDGVGIEGRPGSRGGGSPSLQMSTPFWDRDEDHPQCRKCKVAFTFRVRRHHCRKCGKIFCGDCAPRTNVAPIPQLGYHIPVRHCIDCLPLDGKESSEMRSGPTRRYSISSANKRPYSSALDGIRRMENNCLKNPTSENVIQATQAYVTAIEKIANSTELEDAKFRKNAHAILLRSMQVFLQMPQIQPCIQEARKAHKETDSVLERLSSSASSIDSIVDEHHQHELEEEEDEGTMTSATL